MNIQRRKSLREKLKLDDFESDSDKLYLSRQGPQRDQAKPSQISTHNLGDYTSIVTVEPLALGDDNEGGAASPDDSSSDDSHPAPQTSGRSVSNAASAQGPGAKAAPQAKKLKPSAVYRKKKKHEGANSKKNKKKRQKD